MANSIEEVIYTTLTNDTTFMSNFSAVYWQEADASVYPYIVYWSVDDAGIETRLNKAYQGEARVQFDLWDNNKIRGGQLKTTLREKIRDLDIISGGYHLMTLSVTEQTIQRESGTDPFHYVVDGIIKWNKE